MRVIDVCLCKVTLNIIFRLSQNSLTLKAKRMAATRLKYIDNLRIFLTILVVLHHLIITYGGPGGWYYHEGDAGFPAIIPMSMFVTANQAFFMGMFFFVSAFFIVPSLERKGIKQFVSDRLIRLALPTLIFYFLISPFTVYLKIRFIEHNDLSFLQVLQNGWGMSFGPMWFVEALLIFTGAYLLLRSWGKKIIMKFPGAAKIMLVAFVIGVGQFIIRVWLPVGWSFAGTNMQFPHFLQYIVLFVFGIIAYRNKWMDAVNCKDGWSWFIFAQVLVFVGFPVLFILGGAIENGTDAFVGGFTWQCFAYTIWEQLVGFSLIMALFGIFKKHFNTQGNFARKLSDGAYGVYIFHTPILVGISALFLNVSLPLLLKFVALSPIALVLCFAFAWLVKKVPGVKRVL